MSFSSLIGPLVSAGSSIVGGLLGQSSQEDQFEKQLALQKRMAQHGVRWRVEDAQRAGVHPLFALGANVSSFSPIGIGGNPLGEGIAAAGNEIGRAINAKGTAVERQYNARMMQLSLQRGELENQLLASKIARENSPTQRQPAMPVAGQSIAERFGIDVNSADADRVVMPIPERFGGVIGPAGGVVNVPLERITDPSAPWREPGAISEGSWVRTPTGMAPSPSADANDRMEDVFGPDIAWTWRNMILPNFVDDERVKPPAPNGYRWMWDVMRQEYQLVRD